MKRPMLGGAHRGPVPVGRQRRTLRFVQLLLVLISAGLIMFAGYSLGRVHGYEAAIEDPLDRPRRPSFVQPLVLLTLGGLSLVAAAVLQEGSGVRLPVPARLDELAGRAEEAAIERAGRAPEED